MDLHLRDRVAFVTGGSRGIGLATAKSFAAEGANVAICARDPATLDSARAEIASAASGGARVHTVTADVTETADAAHAVASVVEHFGGFDILVNNAGGNRGGFRLATSTDEDWRQVLEVNLIQTVRMMRLARPHLAGRGQSAIVNIASISGWIPQLAGSGQYGAAKAALIFDAEHWALDLVGDGIRVNTVSPGSILGPGNGWDRYRTEQPEGWDDYVRGGFPMGRLGTLEEVADVVVFLASPRAHWINGRNVPVDGLEQPYQRADRRLV